MDKKIWTKPKIGVVEFEANEYVSSCVDTYSHLNMENTVLFIENPNSGSETLNYHDAISSDSYAASLDWTRNYSGYNNLGTENYFTHMTTWSDSSNKYDQQFFFDSAGKNSTFDLCDEAGKAVDIAGLNSVYDGWWASSTDKSIFGKVKLWWDNRLHAAVLNAANMS